jgi:hypothetical protein
LGPSDRAAAYGAVTAAPLPGLPSPERLAQGVANIVARHTAWVCLSGVSVMFGAFDAGSAPQVLATIPEIIWEASLGLYLTFKGFKATGAVLDEGRDTGVDPGLAIAAP